MDLNFSPASFVFFCVCVFFVWIVVSVGYSDDMEMKPVT